MPDQHLPPPSWPTAPQAPDDAGGARPDVDRPVDGAPAAPPPAAPPPSAPPPGAPPPGAPPPSSPPTSLWSAPGQEPPRQNVPGGWAPPPTPQRPGRRGWVVVLAIVVVIGIVGAVVGLLTGADDQATAGSSETASEPVSNDDAATPATPRSIETGDLSRAEAEAHRDLFETIDESERTMISLNDDIAGLSEESTDEELGAFRDTAGERAAELQDLHDALLAIDDADSTAVATIRDDYADHLQAWIDWSEALAGDPTLLDRPEAAAPYFRAINFTAEGFTSAVANNLDRSRVPDDVLDLADRIIDRGFTSEDTGTEI